MSAPPSAENGFRLIRYAVADRVATITLNDPDRLNAISHGPGSMDAEIVRALEQARHDDDVHCVLFQGAGGNFSSGGTLAGGHPSGGAGEFLHFMDMAAEANAYIRAYPKPTIGAIEGVCYGAALIMALHFDMIIASENASFGFIETRFGGPGVELLPFFVGPQWSKFLALSGELITARRAQSIGLILECFPVDVFPRKAADLAQRVASMPRHAVVLNRRVLNVATHLMGWNSAYSETANSYNAIINSLTPLAEARDGRRLLAILEEDGWKAFKQARDAAFGQPWLDE